MRNVLHTRPLTCDGAVVQGEAWRISVLTDSLLRLEYASDGCFENRATQTVIDREFDVPQYQIRREGEWLFLDTAELELRYNGQPFSPDGLMICLKHMDATWRYGQTLHDLKGTYRTLDGADGDYNVFSKIKLELGHGVLSREGFSVIDDSTAMALDKDGRLYPRKPGTDLYFFGYGHRYPECLRDFYHLCGKTPLLPRYALGNWWSRYHAYTDEEYRTLMTRFEQEQLPFSVAVIDMDWHLVDDVDPRYGTGWTGYTWNRKLFPDPEAFLQWLHDRKLKVSLNVHPADGVRAYEAPYPQMAAAMGIDPACGQAVEFDCTDPKFMEAYFEVLCHGLEKQGVDFWWLDWQQGTQSKMPGMDPLWVLNHEHFLDSAWKGTRPMTFSRYAGIGSHRYPIGFSGDSVVTWDSLNFQPYFTSTASNIGYGWWSHDMGGHFGGIRDDELTARWVQFGVFSPINRLHSTNYEFSGKEPWNYGRDTRDVMNRFLRLRHSLVPYLYTMNRRASREDLPLVQPMYYSEPEREEAYGVPNEYWFGTELVAAPITVPAGHASGAGSVQVWLPEGLWADFFTGMCYRGDRMLEMWRTIDSIPVLMKAGAMVPMKDSGHHENGVENPADMELRIFPAASGSFTLWEDTGDTPADLDENWASTDITLETGDTPVLTIGAAKGNLSVLPPVRTWKLVFCAVQNCAVSVTLDGEAIPAETAYAPDTHSLTVMVAPVDVTKQICVRFKAGLPLADHDVDAQWHRILLRAQMENVRKEEIWNSLRQSRASAEQYLRGTEMPEDVRGCLLEALLA